MRAESLTLEIKSEISISSSILQKLKSDYSGGDSIGGVIRDGQLGWIARDANLEVFSLKGGNRVACYSFDDYQSSTKSTITCVAEVNAKYIKSCLLIIGVQRSSVGGLLYLFSVQGSRIVHRVDVIDTITSCCFINEEVCKRGILKSFDGCIAIGTEAGDIFVVDLNLNRCKEIVAKHYSAGHSSDESTCKIISAPLDEAQIHMHVKQTRIERINLGVKLNTSNIPNIAAVTSILSMPRMQMIAVGLENGLLTLYNLCDLSALHLAYPPEADSPLVKLTYLEPADDPRPCIYIWAFHSNRINTPFAVMHSVSFSSKNYIDGENIYEIFQWSRPDLTIPINEENSEPISCQSITKIVSDEEDEQLSLCLLAWTNRISSFVLIFDLNQWYKEQMPRICDWRDYPSYLAPFPVEINDAPLDIWLNSKSVAAFNSMQRPEEHFYPTSLSLDVIQITTSKVYNLYWTGLQNNAIRKLTETGAIAILLPDECFNEFLEASLIPQLSDQNYHANPSMRMKQEFLLSMALEYSCMNLLRDCAQQWADGSHMGPNADGLTLSTLTDWTWNQAKLIKDRCNDLCVSLFDDSGIALDLRSRKVLAHYSRQLKSLSDLLHMIVTNCRQYIPEEIFDELCCQRNSIRMTSEYQEVLQWLLNMGLLPEIVWHQLSLPEPANDTFTAIPYPYRILKKYYAEQRKRFYDIDRANLNQKTNSCKCLYIDSFIDRNCNAQLLGKEWSDGDGLYPPPSLQAMLRVLLLPSISLENKYMLFVYLFLDLHMVLEPDHFNAVQNLIKFPAVFKLNSTLIKTTQAFWNLDHNEYESALKELISPLTSDRLISKWQQELLVNTLLIRDMPNLALQALRAPGPTVNTLLHVRTLLANSLITEAFELQRSKFDENLLIEFFKGCNEHKKWNYVLNLSLNEREGEILCKFLSTCETLLSENLQLLYFLQRNKYIDALTYLDSLKHKPRSMLMQRKLENTQDLIMSSYQLSMSSTDRSFCDQYMAIRPRLMIDVLERGENHMKPLSCELNPFIVDTNANVVGNVFHRAIISAKRTGFENNEDNKNPSKNYIPLLSNPRIDFDFDENEKLSPVLQTKPYMGQSKRKPDIWNDRNMEPELRQPAAKRQRIDSYSIADQAPMKHAPGISSFLLTSLSNQSNQMLSKKQCDTLILDETIDVEDDQRNSYGELHETVNLLSTPVVKSSRAEKNSRLGSRCDTPQSILKNRHTEVGSQRSISPSLTIHSARRSVDFSEKTYRYTIPSDKQLENERLGTISEKINVEGDDSSVKSSPYSISARRAIHSNRRSQSTSTDEFYSPEPSKKETSQHIEPFNAENGNKITEISQISHKNETPTGGIKDVKARRRLRSTTPEASTNIMSSIRITRSHSKPTEDSTDNAAIALSSSTPMRSLRKRSSERSVNKPFNIEMSTVSKEKQKNLLKDASFASKSFSEQTNLEYDESSNDASQKNLLPESSSFFNDKNYTGHAIAEETKMTVDEASMNQESEAEEPNQNDSAQEITDELDNDKEVEISSGTKKNENEPCASQIVTHVTEIQTTSTTFQVRGKEIMVDSRHEMTVERGEQNLLADVSNMSESMLKKLSEYDACTTSFFNDQSNLTGRGNLLEQSSFHSNSASQQATNTKGGSNSDDDDVVDLDDDDDDDDGDDGGVKENENSISSGESSNNTISSEDEMQDQLVYEESDNEIQDDDVIQIISSDDEENEGFDEENEAIDEDSGDIYYDRDIDEEQKYMDNFGEYSENTSSSKSRDFLPYGGSTQDKQDEYNLAELQSAGMQLENPTSSSQADAIAQEDAINQMIYGDLGADTEMLDLDINNAAIGFELHSNPTFSGMPQNTFELESNSQTFGPIETEVSVVVEQTNVEEVQIQKETQAQAYTQSEIEQNVDESSTSKMEEIKPETGNADTKDSPIEEVVSIEPTQATQMEISEPVDDQTKSVVPAPKQEAVSNQTTIENATSDPIKFGKASTKSRSRNNSASSDEPKTPARRTRRIASQDITSEVEKPADVDVPKTRLRKASSQQSLSSQGEGSVEVARPLRRTTRVNSQKSLNEDIEVTSIERTKRGASQQEDLLETADEPKTPARRTRRIASQDTTSEVEKPADVDVPKTRLRKASSQQSLSSQGEGSVEVARPLSRITRANSQKSLNEDIEVTSIERTTRGASQKKDILETADERKTPARRTRRIASQDPTSEIEKPADVDVPKTRLRKASSQQSLSSQGEGSAEIPKPLRRTTRIKTEQEDTETQDSQELEQKTSKRKKIKDKSEASVDLGDTFNAEESVSSRRLRRSVSHATLNDIIEEEDASRSPLPKRKRGKDSSAESTKPPRRAVSHQSLSSISETDSTDGNPIKKRSSHAGSVAKDETRPRRAASQTALNQTEEPEIKADLGDRFNTEESISSRKLRKAVSHQTLSSIDEIDQIPNKPKGRSKKNSESEAKQPRRAASHQSLSSLSEKEEETPATRSRGKNALAVEKEHPSRRTRRTASEKESPTKTVTEKKTTKAKRGAKKDDDTNSEASSIVSTRDCKTPAIDNEDDMSSVKSTKTKKVIRAGSALPAIVEDEDVEPGTSTSEYLESSRLTRSQRSAIERYAKAKVDTDPPIIKRSSSFKVKAEKEGDTELVESDTESLKSQTSKLSKKSKASEASSQRTTRSLRSNK